MSGVRGLPYLVLSLAGAALLVATALAVILQARATAGPAPALLVEGVPVGSAFPPGFGRLEALVPFAGGVSPVAEEVVPVEHAPEFRGGDWVAAQPAQAWTIQVMAAREEEAVRRFLAGREDRVDFNYFVFPQEGGQWYVVTVGSFPSRELAEGVAASKGLEVGAGKPFARRMSTYQDALRAAAGTLAPNEPAITVPSPSAPPAPALPPPDAPVSRP